METYPKLLAIGIMPPHKIYLIEDENCFIGYAKGLKDENRTDPPVLKISSGSIPATRWCIASFPPKGDENVDELYREIHDIIIDDKIMDYAHQYNCIIKDKFKKDTYMPKISDPKNLVTNEEKEAFKYY